MRDLLRLVRRFGIRQAMAIWRIRSGVRSRAARKERIEILDPKIRVWRDRSQSMPGYRRKGRKGQ